MKAYYEILGVPSTAPLTQIKERYRYLAFVYHPDRIPSSFKNKAENDFKEINEAYQVLSDPISREKYDAQWVSETQNSETWKSNNHSRSSSTDRPSESPSWNTTGNYDAGAAQPDGGRPFYTDYGFASASPQSDNKSNNSHHAPSKSEERSKYHNTSAGSRKKKNGCCVGLLIAVLGLVLVSFISLTRFSFLPLLAQQFSQPKSSPTPINISLNRQAEQRRNIIGNISYAIPENWCLTDSNYYQNDTESQLLSTMCDESHSNLYDASIFIVFMGHIYETHEITINSFVEYVNNKGEVIVDMAYFDKDIVPFIENSKPTLCVFNYKDVDASKGKIPSYIGVFDIDGDRYQIVVDMLTKQYTDSDVVNLIGIVLQLFNSIN